MKFNELLWMFDSMKVRKSKWCKPKKMKTIIIQKRSEAHVLYKMAQRFKDCNIIELGRKYGGSTVVLASGIKSQQGNGHIVSIDNTEVNYVFAEKFIRDMKCDSYVTLVKGCSQVYPFDYKINNVGFVFFDAIHGYEIMDELNTWYKYVKKDGYLVIHDYGSEHKHFGLTKAVNDFMDIHNLKFEYREDRMAIIRKPHETEDTTEFENILEERATNSTAMYQDIGDVKGRRNTEQRMKTINFVQDFKGKSVLDLGCNLGAISIECAKRNAGRVVGVDRNVKTIDLATRYVKLLGLDNVSYNVFHINNGLEKLKQVIGTEQFDYVMVLSVVNNVDPKKLEEIIRYYCRHAIIFEGHAKQSKDKCISYLKRWGFKNIEFIGYTSDKSSKKRKAQKHKRINLIGYR